MPEKLYILEINTRGGLRNQEYIASDSLSSVWRWDLKQRFLRLRIYEFGVIGFICYCSIFNIVASSNDSIMGKSNRGSTGNTFSINSIGLNVTTHMELLFSYTTDIVAQFSLPAVRLRGSNFESGFADSSISTKTSSTTTPSRIATNILKSAENKNYFTHLSYDSKNNVFYAGATNKIIKLNENLRVLSQASTGPKYDSPLCHASGCPDDVETALRNNHNKILIVHYAQGTGVLIVCGSVRQGACDMYNLTSFPNDPQFIDTPLAANEEFASTYAFVGPAKYSWKDEDILYVGTTFTNVGDYRHDVPAISSRRLDDLHYVEFSIQQSIINIDVKYRDHFIVNYVYGFNSSEYAYFAIVQKKSHLADEAGYVTRLARICVADPNYDTYTEVTIQCLATRNDIDYNILRDAKITPAGQKLAQKMGIKRNDSVLVAVFSPSKEITDQAESKSAVCIYSLKYIEEVFNENIHMCFNGTIKDRNLGYVSGTIDDGHCPVAGTIGNIQDFCTVGLKISGYSVITSKALFDFDNVSITSITATNTGPHSLLFLGTETGTIKKVLISGHNAREYEETIVDPGSQILQDTMMSPNNEFLYVLSKRKNAGVLNGSSVGMSRGERGKLITTLMHNINKRNAFEDRQERREEEQRREHRETMQAITTLTSCLTELVKVLKPN